MRTKWKRLAVIVVISATWAPAGATPRQAAASNGDDPDAKPPVTKTALQIVRRAEKILNKESKWNRADNRVCPGDAKIFSIYCALEMATKEITGKFEHRGAAMQEARFVMDAMAPNANYRHRLMGYNNDPRTKFSDLQRFLDSCRTGFSKS